MAHTVIVHVNNDDPIVGEIEELPNPADTSVVILNPRRRDGKPVHYIANEAKMVIFPWHRLTFIEVMPGKKEKQEIVGFFRES